MEYTTAGEKEYMEGMELLNSQVTFNLRKAMECFKSAAEQGHEEAMFQVGWLYLYGFPQIQPNAKKAKEYFEKASETGGVLACHNLALMYFGGIGGERNLEKALDYAKKAFEGGYFREASFLCDAYLYGWGTEINMEKAKEYNSCARNMRLQNAESKYVEINFSKLCNCV